MQSNKYPLITVVTLTYNKFENIYKTIDSILIQDYPNIEYVISDDGSLNFPEKEIKEHIQNSKRNIKHIILCNKKNLGTVRNINTAYKAGNGEYFINLSCGDVFYNKSVVNDIYNRFIEKKAKVICTSRIACNNKYEPLFFLPHLSERKIINRLDTKDKQYKALVLSEYYDMASGSAMSFSREVIEELGYFDESYVLWEDGPFLAKYLQTYCLEFAYDIISIWYGLDGVSSTDKKHRHPLLQKDADRFDEIQRLGSIDVFNLKEQRKLFFTLYYPKCRTRREKLKVIAEYLPEYVHYRIIAIRRRKAQKKDYESLKSTNVKYTELET